MFLRQTRKERKRRRYPAAITTQNRFDDVLGILGTKADT